MAGKKEKLPDAMNRIHPDSGAIEIHPLLIRENGEYITARTMQHTSSVIHHKLDFPEFDYHSLRHTHATMLEENGVDTVFIQRRLGHIKKSTTQIYQIYKKVNIWSTFKMNVDQMLTFFSFLPPFASFYRGAG